MSDALVTRPQHITVQKVASHFKISKKKIREMICPSSLEEGVLYFPELAESDRNFCLKLFCVEAAKFNLSQALDSDKFTKSLMYQHWLNFTSQQDWEGMVMSYVLPGGNVWAVRGGSWKGEDISHGEGVINLAYPYLDMPIRISTLKNYLERNYPSPLE